MFKPIKNTKVYEHIIEQIQNMIVDGTLKQGDKLPSERDLAESLKVSRASVREALRALEIIGITEVRQGEGNFIKTSFDNCLFEPLSVVFMLNKGKPEDILELRSILEIETVALAAARITEEELKELEELLVQLQDTENEEINVLLDKKFHYKIAQASKNFLIVNVLNVISSLMDTFIKEARGKILNNKDNADILMQQHEEIYLSIKHRNPKAASLAMSKHLQLIYDTLMKKEHL
ncbi:transcriptional regulator GntR family [Clostridium aceticum]|uniref:Transcriptional regulator GntR family n=1 Tax=Clostridium aceticum TaxID=84022 RepID=A0A0D8I851_9CLOT|nr:FadR/GntR family transcriptional regulator [Clostridium aceticum]AKL97182.1 transcriptional regulator GntR family [Clostridium aceticum]KJF26217.1 GntR family transcriptional regulator [Clostridium aceticum]